MNSPKIICVEDVIKVLVEKGMTVRDAIREYESSYGRLSDQIIYNIIWEYDHKEGK